MGAGGGDGGDGGGRVDEGRLTVVSHAFERLLEHFHPMQVQCVQPRWVSRLLESFCVDVRVLLRHGREPRLIEVREVLAVVAVADFGFRHD